MTFLALAGAAMLAIPVPAMAAGGGGALAKKKKPSTVSAGLSKCAKRGVRVAIFKGTMRALKRPGLRMEMRFDLYERAKGERSWKHVDVDGFGEWDLSDPDVSALVVKKRVNGLIGGTGYRAIVRYRWRNDAGRVVKYARKKTRQCLQPDNSPDLRLSNPSIVRSPTRDLVVYRVKVKNAGAGSSAPFDMVLAVNGVAQPAQRIGELGPHVAAPIAFLAPRCEPGTIVRFTVDTKAEITESNEANNVLERRCGPSN